MSEPIRSVITVDVSTEPFGGNLHCPYCGEEILDVAGDLAGDCDHLTHAGTSPPTFDPFYDNDLCFRMFDRSAGTDPTYYVFRESGGALEDDSNQDTTTQSPTNTYEPTAPGDPTSYRVFTDDVKEFQKDDAISYNDVYFRKRRFPKKHASHDYSQSLLRLKDKDTDTIEEFADIAADALCGGICIAVVPSHDPKKQHSGIRQVAQRIAMRDGRVDATAAIERTAFIRPLHRGGDNSPDVQRLSLTVARPDLVVGRTVVILDDIFTTGNSLRVCRELLLAHGAATVRMFALGKTWSPSTWH